MPYDSDRERRQHERDEDQDAQTQRRERNRAPLHRLPRAPTCPDPHCARRIPGDCANCPETTDD